MFRNYWLVAIRNFTRYKLHSTINVLGLAIGLAACILIILFVQNERSYDRFHKNADRIYRVAIEQRFGDQTIIWPQAQIALASDIETRLPEVIHATKITQRGRELVQYKNTRFFELDGYYADESFFQVFSFPFIQGDSHTALSDPKSIVVTQKFAQKYFGDENPMGKIIRLSYRQDMMVTGVLRDTPQNSHFKFDYLVPFNSRPKLIGGEAFAYIYLLLNSKNDAYGLEARLFQNSPVVALYQERYGMTIFNPILQALTDIHLYSHLEKELEPNRDVKDLYLFSGIACLILVIACVNYMNLATARSSRRAKEISVRKLVGATQRQLAKQLLCESMLVTILAFILAIALIELALPIFNSHANTALHMPYQAGWFWLGVTILSVSVGGLSGSYPAFVLSSHRPIAVLKGMSKLRPSGTWLRKGLVVFQFAISITLVIVTTIVFMQLSFVKNKSLGFDKEQIVVIPADGIWDAFAAFAKGNFGRYNAFKQELLNNPNILNVSATFSVVGKEAVTKKWHIQGKSDSLLECEFLYVDHDFIKTMGIALKEGRAFSQDFATDLRGAVILNEVAAQKLGGEAVLGKRLENKGFFGKNVEIIGIVKDFHTQSLHLPIQPVSIELFPSEADFVKFFVVKIRTENVPETLDFLRAKWQARAPNFPFNYSFLDEDYDALYRSETQLLQIFGVFASLAILIACLGLFGLVSFMAEIRTKEIGIRKVLGASVMNICTLLSKDLMTLVITANVIAWPVAYFAMREWLQNFAYRIDPGLFIFNSTRISQ